MPCVRGTLDHTGIRAAGAEHPFELDACDDIRVDTVAEFGPNISFHGFKPGRQNDRSDLEVNHFLAVIMIDGARAAGEDALQTLGADAAFQAPLGCLDHFLLGKRLIPLLKNRACARPLRAFQAPREGLAT